MCMYYMYICIYTCMCLCSCVHVSTQAEQIISSMKGQLDDEDMPSHQIPVAMGNIPLHINPKFLEDISNLGVVGGGMQPTELQVCGGGGGGGAGLML